MSLILMGFQGVGKTFFGKKVALQLQLHFVDSDRLVEEKYAQITKKQKSVEQIHQDHGEEFFRKLEKKVILSVDVTKKQIFSLGGGSLMAGFEVTEHIQKSKKKVFLTKDRKLLKAELEKRKPSYLQRVSFDEIYQKRLVFFMQNHDIQIRVDALNESMIVKQLSELFIGE